MKTLLLSLILLGLSTNTWADASTELQQRLSKITHLHANFIQKVTDDKKNTIQMGNGELWMQRPDLFNLLMTEPDESRLVSDGKILWFYNPQVEQVTITWSKEAIGDTPFILIASNHADDWDKYQVEQRGDNFELTPKTSGGNVKLFNINVSKNGKISQFSTVGNDGQASQYTLKDQDNDQIPASTFLFSSPRGVTIDDQRQ